MFSASGVGKKLFFLGAALLTIQLLLSTTLLSQFRVLHDNTTAASRKVLVNLTNAMDVSQSISDMRFWIGHLFATWDFSSAQAAAKAKDDAREKLKDLKENYPDSYEKISQTLTKVIELTGEVVGYAGDEESADEMLEAMNGVTKINAQLDREFANLRDRVRGDSDRVTSEMADLEAETRQRLIEMNAGTVAFCVVLILFLRWRTVRPVRKCLDTLTKIQERTHHVSRNVSSSSGDISSSSKGVLQSSVDQGKSVQSVVASVADFEAMVEQMNDSVAQAKQIMEQIRSKVDDGTGTVEALMGDAVKNQESVRTVERTMGEIGQTANDHAENIESVLEKVFSNTKAINGIVSRTQILSLNASIEAARAGEYGRGFAVVASEVGELAKMSGEAAEEINFHLAESQRVLELTIEDLQKKVTDSAEKVTESLKTAERTRTSCDHTISIFETISENLQPFLEKMHEVSRQTQHQSFAARNVADEIQVIKEKSGMNHSSAVRTDKVSNSLANYSNDLNQQSAALTEICAQLGEVILGRRNKMRTRGRFGKNKKPSRNVVSIKKTDAKNQDGVADVPVRDDQNAA